MDMSDNKYKLGADGQDYWDGTPEEQIAFDAWYAKSLIPTSISQRQCRLYLLSIDLLDSVDVAVSGMGRAAQIEWEFGSYVARDNVLVAGMQGMFSWTDEQMDQMFSAAVLL